MLTRKQRSRRPTRFRSADVLGGSQVVVTAGTVMRLPAAPGALTFEGYNTLSLGATLAGLSGGDVVSIAVDTVDPQSAAVGVLGSSLGRSNVITATGNGAAAGTLYLPNVLTGTIGRPISDVSNQLAPVGAADNFECVNEAVADGSKYVVYNQFPNDILLEFYGGTPFTPSGVARGYKLVVVSGKFGGDAASRVWQHDIRIQKPDGTALTSTVLYAWNLIANGVNEYYRAEFTLLDAECAAIAANAAAYQFRVSTRYGGFGIPDSECRIDQVYMQVNALNPFVTPFARNVLLIDASASAHDVTVSALLAELTVA